MIGILVQEVLLKLIIYWLHVRYKLARYELALRCCLRVEMDLNQPIMVTLSAQSESLYLAICLVVNCRIIRY